jgi:hypothetical protein
MSLLLSAGIAMELRRPSRWPPAKGVRLTVLVAESAHRVTGVAALDDPRCFDRISHRTSVLRPAPSPKAFHNVSSSAELQ